MALARTRRDSGMNYWPGFVDALSTLILGIIFLLTVFVVVQFYLTQEVTGKDTALNRLNAQIAQLTELLSLEKSGKVSVEEELAQLRANLAATEGERDRYKGLYEGIGTGSADAQGKITELSGALDAEKRVTSRALAQIEVLNQQIAALRHQLSALQEALDASETKGKDAQAQITDLGQRLNLALAQRVQELSRYRSDFFGRLRTILGDRPDIRIVGDRFVFQSEVFFDTGQAVLKPEGRSELDQLATALLELDKKIPGEIAWVLRVDGHTDIRPISSPQFRSNWDLSAARAISVVQYLISKGVSPQRLVAAGFGEFQPIDPDRTEEAFEPQPPHRIEADGAVSAAPFTLRRYQAADEAAAIELWRRTWQIAYPQLDFAARVDWWRERWRNELVATAIITVAEASAELIGFVTVDPRSGYLDQIVVAPEAWGSDLARALLDEAKRLSPSGLDLDVNADNARALRFYEKQGFRITGDGVNPRSGASIRKLSWRA